MLFTHQVITDSLCHKTLGGWRHYGQSESGEGRTVSTAAVTTARKRFPIAKPKKKAPRATTRRAKPNSNATNNKERRLLMAKDHHSPNKDKFHEETHRVRSTKRTDMGNAVRLVKDFGEDIRYCPEWKQWLLWDGSRFNPDIAGQIVRLAARSADLYRKNRHEALSDEETGRISGWGATSENFSRLTSTVKLAATDPQVIVHPDELDTDPFLLNVKNGG